MRSNTKLSKKKGNLKNFTFKIRRLIGKPFKHFLKKEKVESYPKIKLFNIK